MQKEMKTELKNKLDETIKAIKANSKDQHFAEELISDLLSLKGQLDIEPTLLHLPLKDVANEFDGETFKMCTMKDGTAVYHVKGGMDIVARPNLLSLNQTIQSLIEDSKEYEKMSEEERDAFDTEVQASAYVLNVPMFAFSDIDFMFDTASSVVKFLKSQFEDAMKEPLKDETPEENQQFENATMALENVKEELESEKNAVED